MPGAIPWTLSASFCLPRVCILATLSTASSVREEPASLTTAQSLRDLTGS